MLGQSGRCHGSASGDVSRLTRPDLAGGELRGHVLIKRLPPFGFLFLWAAAVFRHWGGWAQVGWRVVAAACPHQRLPSVGVSSPVAGCDSRTWGWLARSGMVD